MAQVESKTILILRRMIRKSLGMWAWSAFNPAKARPEELRFDLFDGNEKFIGRFVCTKFQLKFLNLGFTVSTPWGEGRIEFLKGTVRVLLNDRELVQMKGHLFKGGAEFVFPDGKLMQFNKVKGQRNDIIYESTDGYVGFFEEEGTLPEGSGNRPIPMTRDEIKALPKEDRPRSIETNDYIQYRIDVGGTLPVNQDDLARSFCIFAVFGRLLDETPK